MSKINKIKIKLKKSVSKKRKSLKVKLQNLYNFLIKINILLKKRNFFFLNAALETQFLCEEIFWLDNNIIEENINSQELAWVILQCIGFCWRVFCALLFYFIYICIDHFIMFSKIYIILLNIINSALYQMHLQAFQIHLQT